MAETAVIVHADKTVMRITGLRVQGLDTRALEQLLAERLATAVRVIGGDRGGGRDGRLRRPR